MIYGSKKGRLMMKQRLEETSNPRWNDVRLEAWSTDMQKSSISAMLF